MLGTNRISAVPPKLRLCLRSFYVQTYAAPQVTGAHPVGTYSQKLSAPPSQDHSPCPPLRTHTVCGSLCRLRPGYFSSSSVWGDYITLLTVCQVFFAKKIRRSRDFLSFLQLFHPRNARSLLLKAKKNGAGILPGSAVFYFATSTYLLSRMRLTLICPGYSSSDSIFLTMSRATRTIFSSSISSGLTIMRSSLPAWMA